MSRPKILVQLDPDDQPSLFDAVVAIDAGVDQLLQYHHVEPAQVRDLVHGAIFTRGPSQLKHTAIFVGGHDVQQGERLLAQVVDSFFGPLRVSVLLDANGANTTAAAAVLAAARHLDLPGCRATVLAATGPVGQRVVHLLARQGCQVRVASRRRERAESVCQRVAQRGQVEPHRLEPVQTATDQQLLAAIDPAELVVAAGAAGIELLGESELQLLKSLQVAIDLNAVPPVGIAAIEVTDQARQRNGVSCYGAVGVGGTKMKIHAAAISQLFEQNDLVLDLDEVFQLGQQIEKAGDV